MSEPADPNVLAEGLQTTRRAPPGVLVVFGASGDLTSRKLLPALERLSRRRLLPAASPWSAWPAPGSTTSSSAT